MLYYAHAHAHANTLSDLGASFFAWVRRQRGDDIRCEYYYITLDDTIYHIIM